MQCALSLTKEEGSPTLPCGIHKRQRFVISFVLGRGQNWHAGASSTKKHPFPSWTYSSLKVGWESQLWLYFMSVCFTLAEATGPYPFLLGGLGSQEL